MSVDEVRVGVLEEGRIRIWICFERWPLRTVFLESRMKVRMELPEEGYWVVMGLWDEGTVGGVSTRKRIADETENKDVWLRCSNEYLDENNMILENLEI
ncbi:hypothetical protein KM043_015824 [Ampulex compressa]|nr:hypothetical protein KM043_015824 [Ampulex compressa]